MIRDKKLQYEINREAAKISALSSEKIDKYEHLTNKEIFSSNERKIIENLGFHILLKENQPKTIEIKAKKK